MKKDSRGFSLIELLIVVAIILIIAAIAIPSLTGVKNSGNQVSAIKSLQAITEAEQMYHDTYNQGYSTTLAQLGPATGGTPSASASGLIQDTALLSGVKAGYIFKYTPTGAGSSTGGGSDAGGSAEGAGGSTGSGGTAMVLGYTVNADPQIQGKTGTSHYYVDESGTIHVNNTAPAGPNDPTLGR